MVSSHRNPGNIAVETINYRAKTFHKCTSNFSTSSTNISALKKLIRFFCEQNQLHFVAWIFEAATWELKGRRNRQRKFSTVVFSNDCEKKFKKRDFSANCPLHFAKF